MPKIYSKSMLRAATNRTTNQADAWKRRLANDQRFADLKTLRQDNAYQGFRALIADDRLPGDTLQDRVDFVLDVTSDNNVAPTHFSKDVTFSDQGLHDDLRDSPIWGTEFSNQIGHFLTAVDMAQRTGNRKGLYAALSIGHERTGDLVKGGNYRTLTGLVRQSLNVANQLIHGLAPSALNAFDEGVEAAKKGDRQAVNRAAHRLMDEKPDGTLEASRSGNSQADVRLTMYGWAWGEMIKDGEQITLQQGLNFLDHNLAAPNPAAV